MRARSRIRITRLLQTIRIGGDDIDPCVCGSELVNTLRNGSGVPDAGLGIDGDFYIDNDTLEIYGPKAGGAWGGPTALQGPPGDDGGAMTMANVGAGAGSYKETVGTEFKVRSIVGANLATVTEGVDAIEVSVPTATVVTAVAPLMNLRGTYASRPAAGTAGRIYFATDVPLVFYDDGSVWQPHGLTQSFALVYEQGGSTFPITAAAFTTLDQGAGASSITDDKGTLLFRRSYNGTPTADFWSAAGIISGGAPVFGDPAVNNGTPQPFRLTVGFEVPEMGPVSGTTSFANVGPTAGICRHDGTCWSAMGLWLNAGAANLYKSTGRFDTSASSTNFTVTSTAIKHRLLWLRVEDSGGDPEPAGLPSSQGTNAVTWSYSVDGKEFNLLYTEHRINAGTGTQGSNSAQWRSGPFISTNDSDVSMRIFDFKLELLY